MSIRVLMLAAAVSAVAGCSPASPATDPADARIDVVIDGGGVVSLAAFYDDAADAVCGALFRCCDGVDQADYFAPYRDSELLADFRDRLPPAVTLDEQACRDVVAEMFAVVPFGDWVHAAERGEVTFDREGFTGCVGELDRAACGAPVRDALFDGRCFGFAAPSGGEEQRRMFRRTAPVGAACTPLRDGVGAAFYGTCDPTQAFCCYADPRAPDQGCTYPFDGEGVARAGTCAPVSAPGGTCSVAPPLALCRTGASCDADTSQCVEEGTTELAVGAACIDDDFNPLGECVDSFCDILGTSRCEPLRPDGSECSAAYECRGGACVAQQCAPLTTCDGGDEPVGPDAGVEDPVPDAAPPPMATGETCAEAIDLIAAATPSSISGYDLMVAGGFGASNDYNPYGDATPALPPGCSPVYDAGGDELVYRVELDPGDSLVLRYEVIPSSVAGGIYLLDECGAIVDWPDYDGSGACGNNEYRSQGYCGYLGCDPITWTWQYPTTIGGIPTMRRTFWLVLDHLAGAPTGYQLDLRIQ